MGTSENTAGPSRLRGLQPDAGSSHSEDSHPYLPELDDAGEDTTNIADRPRIRRTGKACLPVRLHHINELTCVSVVFENAGVVVNRPTRVQIVSDQTRLASGLPKMDGHRRYARAKPT